MRSEHYLRDGLAAFRQAADWNGEARVLWSLGHLALEQGNLERARATFLDALQMDAELAQQSAPVVQVIVQVPVHGGGLDHASS